MSEFNSNTPIRLNLQAKPAYIPDEETSVLSIQDYREDTGSKTRISTAAITVRVAENNLPDAAAKALKFTPHDVTRGTYANVISFTELFHIPMSSVDYKSLAMRLFEASGFAKEGAPRINGWWRDVVKAMGSLTRLEYSAMEVALLRILNPLIYKIL